MKKLFGGLNITWLKLIIGSVLIGVFTALTCLIPGLDLTSFHNMAVLFDAWILFGILIIVNSKSPKESALKCFIFFVISQPIIYIVQDVFNPIDKVRLFTYYRNWIVWTIACLPMGYFGYFMKKDKWWGLLILFPMIAILAMHYVSYFKLMMFNFPYHTLSWLFTGVTMIIYPIAIFKNKIAKYVGLLLSVILIVAGTIYSFMEPYVYNTSLFTSSADNNFDDTYKVYFDDSSIGDVSIVYYKMVDELGNDDSFYMIKTDFKKRGKTKMYLESPNGEKKTYIVNVINESHMNWDEVK